MTDGQEQSRASLGRHVIGAPVSPDSVMTNDGARLHRDLALGDLFVALRALADAATDALKQELEG